MITSFQLIILCIIYTTRLLHGYSWGIDVSFDVGLSLISQLRYVSLTVVLLNEVRFSHQCYFGR
jgi:hypothetical protein